MADSNQSINMLFKKRRLTPKITSNRQPAVKQHSQVKLILISSIFTISGTIIGALLNSYIQKESEINRRRAEAFLSANKFDTGKDIPQQFFDIKMFADAMQNAALLDDKLMEELISLAKEYPGCQVGPAALSTSCKPYHIKTAIATRIAAGGSKISYQDMDVFLGPRFLSAKAAAERLTGRQIP